MVKTMSSVAAVAAPPGAAPPTLAAAAQAADPAGMQAAIDKRINPTKRELRFIAPVADGANYLGEIEMRVSPKDEISLNSSRLLQMLEPLVEPAVLTRLTTGATNGLITDVALEAEEIGLSYDNARLALTLAIPVKLRPKRALSLRNVNRQGEATLQPASLSAYMNLRSAFDVVERGADRGLLAPVTGLDAAVRALGVVVEGEGLLSLRGEGEPLLRRSGSRLVYDYLPGVLRLTAGDLRPSQRTFQAAPALGGVGMARLYNLLEPQRITRASGGQTVTISSPSFVETYINGRSVERRRFDPGTYSLSDFPLAEGANDVRLVVEDESGGRRQISFNVFSNASLLTPGLDEFAAYVGVPATPTRTGITYGGEMFASGFWRRGVSDQLTLGASAQGDRVAQQLGGEMLLGTSLGLIGVDLAGSRADGIGSGAAALVTYQFTTQSANSRSRGVRASVEWRSLNFVAPAPGSDPMRATTALIATANYSHQFGLDSFLSADVQHVRNRFGPDDSSARALLGFRLTHLLSATGEAEYRQFGGVTTRLARLGLTYRFGRSATARAEVDSLGRLRAGYQDSGGRGIGAWNVAADINRTSDGLALNANGGLLTNRAELGIGHIALYDSLRGRIGDQRTSFRAATSLAFADGLLAIGRPIFDSFLLARGHSSLSGKTVQLDATEQGDSARSGALGPALASDLSAYSPRTLIYEVPEAPQGYDLGAGNVLLYPAYKSGYRLEIGSDYNLMVIGKLVDADGAPVVLLAGSATEQKGADRAPVSLFTSRDGRFAAQGLRPGVWQIKMPTEPPSTFTINVIRSENGIVRLGTIRPAPSRGER
jgi:outer membrane usher protein